MEILKRTLGQATPFYMQPVDIIIPFHGEYDKVTRLMESIFSTIRTNRYQITLVDDGSPNKEFCDLFTGKAPPFKSVPGVVAFQHNKQKGFGAAVNTGVRGTRQPHIVVMQSDVAAEGNTWLANLGETLCNLKSQGVKMVSPMTDNPVVSDHRLMGKRKNFRENTILENGYLPMYCFICHRELFKRLGPLSEFPYAGGEAEEFAHRMRVAEYKQAVCGSSWVHHDGRATLSQYDNKPKVQDILNETKLEVAKKVEQK